MDTKTRAEPSAEQVLAALLNITENGNGGGVNPLFLAALGPVRYNALSKLLHDCGLCGGEGA